MISAVEHGEFRISVDEKDGAFIARIERPGDIRHFGIRHSHLRAFAIDLGPFDTAGEALAVARVTIDDGHWNP